MALIKTKLSELPICQSLIGFWTIGVDAANKSVRVSLEFICEVIESAKTATKDATDAAEEAEKQADRAKLYSDNPPTQGENGNWWSWDEETNAYKDTGILAKGGTLYPTFHIDTDTMELIVSYSDVIVEDMFGIDEEGNLIFKPK